MPLLRQEFQGYFARFRKIPVFLLLPSVATKPSYRKFRKIFWDNRICANHTKCAYCYPNRKLFTPELDIYLRYWAGKYSCVFRGKQEFESVPWLVDFRKEALFICRFIKAGNFLKHYRNMLKKYLYTYFLYPVQIKETRLSLFRSRRDSVRESGEGFYFQISFVSAIRTDRLSISLYILYQLFAAEIRIAEKFLAKVNRHRHVYFVFVLVPRFLRYLNFPTNALAEIEHR